MSGKQQGTTKSHANKSRQGPRRGDDAGVAPARVEDPRLRLCRNLKLQWSWRRRRGRFDIVEPVEHTGHRFRIVGDERKRVQMKDRQVAFVFGNGSVLGPAGEAQNQSLDAPREAPLQERVWFHTPIISSLDDGPGVRDDHNCKTWCRDRSF